MGVLCGENLEHFELSNHKSVFVWDDEGVSDRIHFFLFEHFV